MDAAPLSAAHAHARNAAALGQGPNLKGAQEEHELAAQDFAKAKATVGDSEVGLTIFYIQPHDLTSEAGSPHPRSPRTPPPETRRDNQVAICTS